MQGFRRHAVEGVDVRVTCFMNISSIGLVGENYEAWGFLLTFVIQICFDVSPMPTAT